MTPGAALTPDGALGWLRSMSVDIRDAAVLDAAGAVLAGSPDLASPAGRAGSGSAVTSPAADVLVARSPMHAIVVRSGPCAIERLLRADLQAALDALASE